MSNLDTKQIKRDTVGKIIEEGDSILFWNDIYNIWDYFLVESWDNELFVNNSNNFQYPKKIPLHIVPSNFLVVLYKKNLSNSTASFPMAETFITIN